MTVQFNCMHCPVSQCDCHTVNVPLQFHVIVFTLAALNALLLPLYGCYDNAQE